LLYQRRLTGQDCPWLVSTSSNHIGRHVPLCAKSSNFKLLRDYFQRLHRAPRFLDVWAIYGPSCPDDWNRLGPFSWNEYLLVTRNELDEAKAMIFSNIKTCSVSNKRTRTRKRVLEETLALSRTILGESSRYGRRLCFSKPSTTRLSCLQNARSRFVRFGTMASSKNSRRDGSKLLPIGGPFRGHFMCKVVWR
jgi:hypothetical protein